MVVEGEGEGVCAASREMVWLGGEEKEDGVGYRGKPDKQARVRLCKYRWNNEL